LVAAQANATLHHHFDPGTCIPEGALKHYDKATRSCAFFGSAFDNVFTIRRLSDARRCRTHHSAPQGGMHVLQRGAVLYIVADTEASETTPMDPPRLDQTYILSKPHGRRPARRSRLSPPRARQSGHSLGSVVLPTLLDRAVAGFLLKRRRGRAHCAGTPRPVLRSHIWLGERGRTSVGGALSP
jgi:hypothetical protein